jgi:transposase
VIDNLKAAVLQAALEDQKLAEPYRKLAQHYGCLIHPCRPRAAQHKGMVENGVHYVQRNLLATEQPIDFPGANRAARIWVMEVAGVREHGTTHVPPLRRFHEEEQAALLPLPAEPFSLREVRGVKVHRDCHVQVDGSYYSAPFPCVGRKLDAYVYEHTVQLYEGVTLLVTHPRARRPGERHTRLEHYPQEECYYLIHTREYCQAQAARTGPCCAQVVEQLLEERPLDRLRSVQGLLGLARRYSPVRLEAACARALHYGDASYRRLKRILAAGLDQVPLDPGPLQPELRFYEYARPVGDFFAEEVKGGEAGRETNVETVTVSFEPEMAPALAQCYNELMAPVPYHRPAPAEWSATSARPVPRSARSHDDGCRRPTSTCRWPRCSW